MPLQAPIEVELRTGQAARFSKRVNDRLEIKNFKLIVALFLTFSFIPTLVYGVPPPLKNFDHPRLIETTELATVVNHPSIRIVDMRNSLTHYLKGHIPNAVYLHFETLQVPKSGVPAQSPDRFCLEKLLGDSLSLSNNMWVIIYSERSNPNATFLAWTLDFLGHKRFGILNGGWEKWHLEKHPITQVYPSLIQKKFFGKTIWETLAEKNWVRNQLSAKDVVIVDARPPKQYSGDEGEEIRRGHIPKAKNIFWETTLEGDEIKIWKKKEELEKIFSEHQITKDKKIIVYCHTGREASHVYFTLKYILGFPYIRLFRGSWVEWAADQTLSIKLGMDP